MNDIYTNLIYSLLILVVGSIGTIILARVTSTILNGFTKRTKTKTDDFIASAIVKSLKPIGLTSTIYLSTLVISTDKRIIYIIHACFKLILLFLIIKCLNKIILHAIERWTLKIKDEAIITMVDALNPLIKASIWTIGVIFYLQNMGVQMAAIWALLSAGGIGAGLALKEPVQEFFEYIIILLDKPFQNGEFINVENVWATVERVGVRSTRLRSLNGEKIVVSNTFLTNGVISNYAQMNKRRLVHRLGVVYETNISTMANIPKIIEEIVDSVDNAKFDRCHFVEFGNFSLDFELVYFIPTNNYSKAMMAQQTINLEIMRKFKEEGIEFAFPTQTINLINNDVTKKENGDINV